MWARSNPSKFWLGLAWVCASPCVLAHVGAESTVATVSWFEALMHPFTGVDHLAAMLAVGIWSALFLRLRWVGPLVFVGSMGLGIGLGVLGFNHVAVEPMIACSVLVLGLFVAVQRQLPLAFSLVCIGLFGLSHGTAHGLILQTGSQIAPALAMLCATAVLHIMGLLLGRYVMAQRLWLQRVCGAAFSLLGFTLLLGFA